MSIPFTPLVESLPASTPFVGPEALERAHGSNFRARIGANESAFGISPLARAAIKEALEEPGQSWYADPENFELRTVLAKKHGVSIEEICVDSGIDSLLGLTVRMLVSPGSDVVTSAGAYPTFNYHVAGFGGVLNSVPYINNHEDPDSLIARAKETRANLVYIANPDNPMGTWQTVKKMEHMIRGLPDNCVLILDEAYSDFTNWFTAPLIDTSNEQVMRFRTFSKVYGMAGMRIGYVISNSKLITGLNKIRNHFAVNRLSQLAATVSVSDTDFLDLVQQQVEEGRNRIYTLANDMQLPYLESATNFVAVDMGTEDKARSILQNLNNEGVFMRMPGAKPLSRYIRVGVGSSDEHAYFETAFKKIMDQSKS